MAKGQKRSNREIKKPKKDKVAPKVENPFAKKTPSSANTNTKPVKGNDR